MCVARLGRKNEKRLLKTTVGAIGIGSLKSSFGDLSFLPRKSSFDRLAVWWHLACFPLDTQREAFTHTKTHKKPTMSRVVLSSARAVRPLRTAAAAPLLRMTAPQRLATSSPLPAASIPLAHPKSGKARNQTAEEIKRGESTLHPQWDAGYPEKGDTALDELVPDHLAPAGFVRLLEQHGMDFFTGVPDSLLKDFAAYVDHHVDNENHVMTANEGNAIAVAAGYHCATRKIPVVYMQNSGIGNAVNPLLSLAARRVYSIPMLVLVGWRGEPGHRDEPQHMVQGEVLPAMLTSMGVRFDVLPDYSEGVAESISLAAETMRKKNSPYVFLVRKGTFAPFKPSAKRQVEFSPAQLPPMKREDVLSTIIDLLDPMDCTVATTGFTSRELYEQRNFRDQEKEGRDFLMVGSMGHATAFALGVALHKDRGVYCLDGDGAMLMHTGTMATIGKHGDSLHNFKHILLNNGAHDSVGGQSSGAFGLNMGALASGFGYRDFRQVTTEAELTEGMKWLSAAQGPVLLEVRCQAGARKDLGRPKSSTVDNKRAFMEFLNQ
jgi:phosphonopyruvate decarboxylase